MHQKEYFQKLMQRSVSEKTTQNPNKKLQSNKPDSSLKKGLTVFDSPKGLQPKLKKSSVVLIGNYDGVHYGHRKLIQKAQALAKKQNWNTILLTFDPHPVQVLAPKVAPKLLNTSDQKQTLLNQTGLDFVATQKFTKAFAAKTPKVFFEEILIKNLKAKAVFVGHDFTFGAGRAGNIETLEVLGLKHDVAIHIIEAQLLNNMLVSSTLVRKLLAEGQCDLAAKLLQRFYFVDGKVISGHQRGQKLGISTANLAPANDFIPKDGVYATFVSFKGKLYQSATNVGTNPTFAGNKHSIETHIFDFSEDIYDQNIRLHFVKRLRDEKRFESPDSLVKQIKDDIKKAKQSLKAAPKKNIIL